MHEIVPGQLWIGNAADARDPRRLHAAGIVAVVDLAYEEPPAQLGREFVYFRIPLLDGADNPPEALALAIETTASIVRHAMPLLVACSAGLSRSPSIVAAALAAVHDLGLDESLRRIAELKSLDVSPALWSDVRTVVGREPDLRA